MVHCGVVADGDAVGVGPWAGSPPDDPRLDPQLLAHGDSRNVVDRFRYWREEAIREELRRTRCTLEVAIENWRHDLNIGSIVRTANAMNVECVHIVGARRWNRRGAMVTDRYIQIRHQPTVVDLVEWATSRSRTIIGIDTVPAAVPLETYDFPELSLLLFGSEGSGLSREAADACEAVLAIGQFGSTRSMNAGAAAAVAIHSWVRRHRWGQNPNSLQPVRSDD
ncbi:MAG: rRNA methyltransferase [Nocardioidaceae bacterium]|nr:rRNA methyltransferase [Nocardioidaceae bacterium]